MARHAAAAQSESLDVMVESPRGATVKFKYDPAARVMTVSRPLPLELVFPFDWGFVRATRAEDGDPLDAFILWDAFLLHSGVFEGKDAKVLSWKGPEAALRAVREASRKAGSLRRSRR